MKTNPLTSKYKVIFLQRSWKWIKKTSLNQQLLYLLTFGESNGGQWCQKNCFVLVCVKGFIRVITNHHCRFYNKSNLVQKHVDETRYAPLEQTMLLMLLQGGKKMNKNYESLKTSALTPIKVWTFQTSGWSKQIGLGEPSDTLPYPSDFKICIFIRVVELLAPVPCGKK